MIPRRRRVTFVRDLFWNLLVNRIAASSVLPRPVRCALYRLVGIDVRTNTIGPGVFFLGRKTSIGNSFVNRGVQFDSFEQIDVGDRCAIAMEVMFLTGSHEIGSHEKRAGAELRGPIRVGDGCWIGARATILPGVTIGPGCVVAAGAVVADDCDPDGLYGGVPARRLRDLD